MYNIAMILSAISNILFLVSTQQHDKTQMFAYQVGETSLNIVKGVLLGGYSGSAVQVVGLVRNILLYLGLQITSRRLYVLLVIQVLSSLAVNNHGLLGLLPIIGSTSYTYINFKSHSVVTAKYSLILNLSLWFAYDVLLRDYITVAVDIVTIIATGTSVYRIKKLHP